MITTQYRHYQIKSCVKQIIEELRSIMATQLSLGIRVPPSKELFLQLRDHLRDMVIHLNNLGVTWDYLVRVSGVSSMGEHKEVSEDKPTTIIKLSSFEQDLYIVVDNLGRLYKEMKECGTPTGYLSQEVFRALYPETCVTLDNLTSKGVTWTSMLTLAEIPVTEVFKGNSKRESGLACKTFMESFGITVEHMMLFQKLLAFMVSENSECVDKFAKDTFNIKVVNDRFYKYMLSRLSEFIKFIKTIS